MKTKGIPNRVRAERGTYNLSNPTALLYHLTAELLIELIFPSQSTEQKKIRFLPPPFSQLSFQEEKAAMLSLTPPKPTVLFTRHHHHRAPPNSKKLSTIVASFSFSSPSSSSRNFPTPPPPAPPGEVYQPFRPPPAPLPNKYRSLDAAERIEILRNRLGLWHEYAPLISTLSHDGFTPPSIEELTGISGVEQNRLAVAVRVRESLLSSPDLLPFFDSPSSADILYELRLLNTSQRTSAASYAIQANLDARSAQDLARAIKDFPRRRGDPGWYSFAPDSPADCLAYTYFRLSIEAIAVPDKIAALEKALTTAESDAAKDRIQEEIKKISGKGEGVGEEEGLMMARLPVVRLRYGEVAESSSVVLLPVCRASDGGGVSTVKEAPFRCKWEGELGVVESDKGWGRWVVLPGWPPVLGLAGEGGVAIEFADARALPWRLNSWEKEEGVVVVVDRKRKEVVGEGDEGFYLVSGVGEEEGLGVERGINVGEKEVLGAVVLVVRPPREEDDQLDEDWD